MYIKKRKTALAFRLVSTCVAIAGILAIMFIGGKFSLTTLLFYTLMSNIAVLIYFVITACFTYRDLLKDGPMGEVSYFPKISMFLAVDILLTLLVYWVLLAPQSFAMGSDYPIFSFANITVHTVTPLLMIVDYLIFNKRRVLKFYHSFYVLIFPLSYAAFAMLIGQLGYVFMMDSQGNPMHAPYFFMEIDKIGWMVLVYIAVIAVALSCLGLLGYLIDRKGSNREYTLTKKS